MIRNTLRAFLAAWRSISFVASVLAILWFWPDIRDLPKAYGLNWDQILPDRGTVEHALLGIALLWILWMDARPTVGRWLQSRKERPLKIAWGENVLWTQRVGEQVFMVWTVKIRNASSKTLEGVEVFLNRVVQKAPGKGTKMIEGRLSLKNSDEKSFDILPGMAREVCLFRAAMSSEPQDRIEFGKVEGQNTYVGCSPGLYRAYITIFGRNLDSPMEIEVGIGFDSSGAIMYGQWRDDMPWPFTAQPGPIQSTAMPDRV
jgi:hypothetical protein